MIDEPSRPSQMRSAFPPLEPSELAKEAERFEFNPLIPLKNYVGALDTLYREGRNYLRERNFAKAYLLLFRFSILYLDRVSHLAEAQTPRGRVLLKATKRRINGVLVELENIKPDLIEARNRWTAEHPEATRNPDVQDEEPDEGFAARDAALSWNAKARATLLDASQHQDFAVDLATEELNRRRDTRRHGDTSEDGVRRRTGSAATEASGYAYNNGSEIQSQMEQARRQLDRRENDEAHSGQRAGSEDPHSQPVPVIYHYPSISKPTALRYNVGSSTRDKKDPEPVYLPGVTGARPPRPPKEGTYYDTALSGGPSIPPVVPPRRELASSSETLFRRSSPLSNDHPPRQPPLPPKTSNDIAATEKETYTFRPAGYLENEKPVRPIFLPEGLRKDFVRIAAENTGRGIETCGILCGTNINNALFITCLLVPEQHGTPDTCETTNEAATFDFFEKEDLLQIGWIHTHPTQTCFMSSRDLHTQAGYQIMMDESIAIVCSPSHEPSWGIFRLTKPPGLQHLLNCEKTDTFHQHSLPADALYVDAKNPPGHVFVTSRMNYRIHDLRNEV